jgi:ketosteroid isomerase-like protein
MDAKILSSTAEDDRVALEATLKAVTHSGLVYENEYLLQLRFRDNKIIYIAEFLDQQETLAFAKAVEEEQAKR